MVFKKTALKLRYAFDLLGEVVEWHNESLCRDLDCRACDRMDRRDDRISDYEMSYHLSDETGAYLNMKDFMPKAKARYR